MGRIRDLLRRFFGIEKKLLTECNPLPNNMKQYEVPDLPTDGKSYDQYLFEKIIRESGSCSISEIWEKYQNKPMSKEQIFACYLISMSERLAKVGREGLPFDYLDRLADVSLLVKPLAKKIKDSLNEKNSDRPYKEQISLDFDREASELSAEIGVGLYDVKTMYDNVILEKQDEIKKTRHSLALERIVDKASSLMLWSGRTTLSYSELMKDLRSSENDLNLDEAGVTETEVRAAIMFARAEKAENRPNIKGVKPLNWGDVSKAGGRAAVIMKMAEITDKYGNGRKIVSPQDAISCMFFEKPPRDEHEW